MPKINIVNSEQPYFENQGEIEKLRLDNAQLKQNLEKEEFLHKSLYKQWSELHNLALAKEREVERLKSRSVFYKYGFYLILFLIIPAYYFLTKSQGDAKISAPVVSTPSKPVVDTSSHPVVSASTQTTNEAPSVKQDTVPLTPIKQPVTVVEKPKVVLADTVQAKVIVNNKPVADPPLSDSAKDSIYWIGWNAYYGKSPSPFKKYPLKNKIWLQGWKDGENDSKKQSGKDSLTTQH